LIFRLNALRGGGWRVAAAAAACATVLLVIALPRFCKPCGDAWWSLSTPESRLLSLWSAYKQNYMQPGGDVRDPLRGGRVTSEAQSYALLQAAWLRDADTFERVRKWTDDNLKRSDGLYAWLWDPRDGGRVIDVNTATDGDTDIAFALVIAADAFNRPDYRAEAQQIVRAIRANASLRLKSGWFPSAGNWAAAERIANLSYFAPYAYEYFERLDPGAGWAHAISIGYDLLDQATARGELPADFVAVDGAGALAPLPATSTLNRVFSFDSIRIPWRIELDCRVHRRQRACADPLVDRLQQIFARDRRLVTRYTQAGMADATDESLSFYGAVLPAFSRKHPGTADALRRSQLSGRSLSMLRAATNRYYDANWAWFGLAAADGLIVERTPALGKKSEK
jgi:endo-1,4-beta-D-glucanase Y